jgi:hypothetical protein
VKAQAVDVIILEEWWDETWQGQVVTLGKLVNSILCYRTTL